MIDISNNGIKLSLLIRSSAITPPPDEVPRIRHTLIPAGGVSAAKPKRKRGQKGGRGKEGESETNVPERNEKRRGRAGGGKKEARRVIARDCTVARIIARAPEKRHFKFVHPPEKRTFSSLLRAPVPIGSTEYPRYPSFERRFFETPAMLSPRPSYNISPWP